MATDAPITGAPTRAPLLRPELTELEDIAADFATLDHVIDAALDTASPHSPYLLEAASLIAGHVGGRLNALIEGALSDRTEGR